MGKKCPQCESTNTKSELAGSMHCKDCSYAWKPKIKRSKKTEKETNDGLGLTTLTSDVMDGL
jgi:uncharacterized Zn ribbon protein